MTKTKKFIVACIPIELRSDNPNPLKYTASTCDECGKGVWLGQNSRVVAEEGQIVKHCFDCVFSDPKNLNAPIIRLDKVLDEEAA